MATTIKVGGKALDGYVDAVIASDSSMLITVERKDRTIDDIVGIFADGAKIEVLSGKTVTATYYNKTVDSVKLDGDKLIIHIGVNALSDSAESELTDRADTSDGAIEDLAAMIADLEERVTALEGNGVEGMTEEVAND